MEFLKLLQEKLLELRRVFAGTGLHYRRPHYRICVLYVDETTSVQRQLARGARAVAHNQNIPNENGLISSLFLLLVVSFFLKKYSNIKRRGCPCSSSNGSQTNRP